jgi:CAAX protease family protein
VRSRLFAAIVTRSRLLVLVADQVLNLMLTSVSDHRDPSGLAFPWLVALHLCPGVVFSGLLIVLSRVFIQQGLTAYLAELVLIPACLAPMLAGIVLLWSRRPGEPRTVIRALAYRERGTLADYVLWPISLFLCWAVCSLGVNPLVGVLEARFFQWFPARLGTQAMISAVTSSPAEQRNVMFVLAILLSGLLAPLAEEAYFRAFLLPRMSHLGRMAPVVSAFLFGLYHFFCPWNLPAIFVAFLPVGFVVQARRNFRIGVVVHAMFNLAGVLTLFLHSG